MKEYRVLLINPPYPGKTADPSPSLGYLGSMIEGVGASVDIWDGEVLYSYREKLREVIDLIAHLKPDLIGFTLTTPFVRFAYNLAGMVKDKFDIPLIAGGTHATFCPEEVIEKSVFDIAVVGEAEYTIIDLIKYFRKEMDLINIPGIVYKDSKGNIISTQRRPLINDLDELLFPLGSQSILKNPRGGVFGQILTSRGCPGKCVFCGSLVHGKQYRFRSAENVFKEMLHLHKTYGVTHFRFQDDALTINQSRFNKLCNIIIDYPDSKFTWNCQSRADALSPNLLRQMKKAGCSMINIGLEAASPEVAKKVKKNLSIDKVFETIETCRLIKLPLIINLMTGFPFETREDIRYNIDFMKSVSKNVSRFDVGLVLIPYPGTEIYNKYHQEYGFSEWWLKDGFTLPLNTDYVPLYLDRRLGSWTLPDDPVLERDFFHYPRDIKKEIKRFVSYKCWFSMKKSHGIIMSLILLLNFYLSKFLYRIAPFLEKVLMGRLLKLQRRVYYIFASVKK